MGLIRDIKSEAQLQEEIHKGGNKLVVVDFTASWCGPCQRIAPAIEAFAAKYVNVVFLQVDFDANKESATCHNVMQMPTFIFFKNKVKVERILGADPVAVENAIKKYSKGDEEACPVPGHMDLVSFLMKEQCTVINEEDGQSAKDILNDDDRCVKSDCDEQLLFSFTFSQRVKIHSIIIKAPQENGPKTIKIFTNQPGIMDFSAAESVHPVQELIISPDDLTGKVVNLKYVKFQNVNTVDMFIVNNQNGSEVTQVNYLSFIGSPISGMNMEEFKRIAGKKGEVH